jgi:hypothetical protein
LAADLTSTLTFANSMTVVPFTISDEKRAD